MTISIMIADDESLIRNLFISALKRYDDIKVVGQAGNGDDTINILKRIQPNVLLLDLNMPKKSGLEVLQQIESEDIKVNTLVISMENNDKIIAKVINAGALGFINKDEEWDDMHEAIITVSKGEFYHTKRINSILLKIAKEEREYSSNQRVKPFSEREMVIIKHLKEGLSSSEIADKIYCSKSTIDRIRQELIHRVGANNTIGLIAFVTKNNILENYKNS